MQIRRWLLFLSRWQVKKTAHRPTPKPTRRRHFTTNARKTTKLQTKEPEVRRKLHQLWPIRPRLPNATTTNDPTFQPRWHRRSWWLQPKQVLGSKPNLQLRSTTIRQPIRRTPRTTTFDDPICSFRWTTRRWPTVIQPSRPETKERLQEKRPRITFQKLSEIWEEGQDCRQERQGYHWKEVQPKETANRSPRGRCSARKLRQRASDMSKSEQIWQAMITLIWEIQKFRRELQ